MTDRYMAEARTRIAIREGVPQWVARSERRPGLYSHSITRDLQAADQHWPALHGEWHIALECVVDDFGTLVPVDVRGIIDNRLVRLI